MLVATYLQKIHSLLNFLPVFSVVNLIIVFIIVLSTKVFSTFYTKDYSISVVKLTIIVVLSINLILIFFKIILQFILNQYQLLVLTEATLSLFNFTIIFNWNLLGTSLLILCYVTTIICLVYLGDRNIFGNSLSGVYFLIFLVCTTFLVTTTNLLIMFLSFECIFVPSIFFVYSLGYVKKVDKTIYFLLLWTLFGSFMVLFGLAYIYSVVGSLNFFSINNAKFTDQESFFIYLCLFIGYGMKVPLFPFHYWLTKVHVEAPAGFSIFLSGFLVKTAAYCFYYISLIFSSNNLKIILVLWCLLGVVEASLKMWSQLDIKKLIAFATIQEMNMIIFCLLLVNQINLNLIAIFFLLHGLLSSYMFLLVDQIQKRMQTRNILELSGTGVLFPLLRNFIWYLIIFFLGFPGTTKFIIEWHVGFLLVTVLHWVGFFVFFIALVSGGVGFTKCWLLILYGNPSSNFTSTDKSTVDLFKKDQTIFYVLLIFMFLLSFMFVLINCL